MDAARAAVRVRHELAEQVGLVGGRRLGADGARRAPSEHGGDWPAPRATLLEALRVCERAGLLPQSVQANAALAAACLRDGDTAAAREAAARAVEDAERVHDPAAVAAAAEAQAVLADAG